MIPNIAEYFTDIELYFMGVLALGFLYAWWMHYDLDVMDKHRKKNQKTLKKKDK